ncbi:hypothetical protein ElyMa_002797800 [Elysia marginata]|uniref:Uncharacterized protein n=1 Tax=Elysia marginata TaxID=1093978 RepID=A0AAV4HQE0_9GAST|nr:hypothetical protein ElyMa_002797800 [Elysia marginata]
MSEYLDLVTGEVNVVKDINDHNESANENMRHHTTFSKFTEDAVMELESPNQPLSGEIYVAKTDVISSKPVNEDERPEITPNQSSANDASTEIKRPNQPVSGEIYVANTDKISSEPVNENGRPAITPNEFPRDDSSDIERRSQLLPMEENLLIDPSEPSAIETIK